MKRLFTLVIIGLLAFNTPVYASTQTLDQIINEVESTEQLNTEINNEITNTENEIHNPEIKSNNVENKINNSENNITSINVGLNYIKDANNLGELSPTASKINNQIRKAASFVIQVLAYFITAFLSVRVLLDLCYIVFPFGRSILNRNGGMQSSLSVGGNMNSMNNMGNMNSMNNMGNMNSMGNGRMNIGSPIGMQGASGTSGKMALISQAAINAANSELDGTKNALKIYAKDMIIVLVVTPILLVLAITGTLTNLGFLLGEVISNIISNIGNMI